MQLQIDIKDSILRSYLSAIFKATPDGLLASTWTITGSVICALAMVSFKPVKRRSGEATVTVILPDSHINSRKRAKFLYLRPKDEETVNLVLRREFTLRFMEYCYEGRIAGLKQKDIVASFIADHNLDSLPTSFETLSKRRQRVVQYAERNFAGKLKKRIQNRTYRSKKSILITANN